MHSPTLLFGIEADGRRSWCWRVRSGARLPELFIEPEGIGHEMHVSLHASGAWHVKVKGHPVHQWVSPNEFHPGFTRALLIVQPAALAKFTAVPPAGAVLVKAPTDDEPINFNIFIERPGADLTGWPGKDGMGTKLVGRLDLAGGAGTCVVTSHAAAVGDVVLTMPKPSDHELDDMKAAAAAGNLHGTVVAAVTDGTVCFLDGIVEPSPPV